SGSVDVLRPDAAIARAAAEIAVVVLLFCMGLDHGADDRRAAAAALATGPGRVLAIDALLNFAPGALFGLLAGFGVTGAVLLGGATWASSWAASSGVLDRGARFGNRETPAVLTVLVLEHAATAVYLPAAAALLAPADAVTRVTAVLGSATLIAAAIWLFLGPPLPQRGRLLAPAGTARPGSRRSAVRLGGLLAGTALVLAGMAAAIGVATAAFTYLAGALLAGNLDDGGTDRSAGSGGPVVAVLRDLSSTAAGLALGLLVPADRLPGAVAGGVLLAGVGVAGKVLTGWWAAGCLRPAAAGAVGAVGRAGRLRAGAALVARGEVAVVLGVLAALSAGTGRGPGTSLAALAAVEVILTGLAAAAAVAVQRPQRPGWYRLAVRTLAPGRLDPSGAG
ncbi:MAG TPA: hypothetical protein VEG38_16550, partial [Acidimicrobiia bacterium]|nr:hypothetical protein [Acidimicrobiia bacterium]